MYRNPVTGIPEHVYYKILGNKPTPKEGDVIFLRRGSYRIGTVAMASPRDAHVLLMSELLTLRISNTDNKYGITPFYLLALLSSQIVQERIDYYVYVDTTLPYQLANDADVSICIYATDGTLVRRLTLGDQPAGVYQSKVRAAYEDGRNTVGEPVASGVYFYTLTTGTFTAARKMLIMK